MIGVESNHHLGAPTPALTVMLPIKLCPLRFATHYGYFKERNKANPIGTSQYLSARHGSGRCKVCFW